MEGDGEKAQVLVRRNFITEREEEERDQTVGEGRAVDRRTEE